MKNTPRIYVFTLHSPSRKALRMWRGRSIHALRHCSAKQIGHALMEMQQHLDDLQSTMMTPGSDGSYSLNRSR
jgi:hypothetical protein